MRKKQVSIWQVFVLFLVLGVMLIPGFANAAAKAEPQRGGVLKIIDVAEGAQPIGAPWDDQGNRFKT